MDIPVIFPKQWFLALPSGVPFSSLSFKPVTFHVLFHSFTHSLSPPSTHPPLGSSDAAPWRKLETSSLFPYLVLRCGMTSSESINGRYSMTHNFLESFLQLWSPLLLRVLLAEPPGTSTPRGPFSAVILLVHVAEFGIADHCLILKEFVFFCKDTFY